MCVYDSIASIFVSHLYQFNVSCVGHQSNRLKGLVEICRAQILVNSLITLHARLTHPAFNNLETLTMASRGKSITLQAKLDVIAEIEKEEMIGKVNFVSIGKKFELDRSTVSRISKNRESLKEQATSGLLSVKRKRTFKEEDVDAALFLWTKQKLEQNARLNLPIMKTKATELAKELGHDFEPTDGWLNRFKSRHGLKFKKEHGEQQATDTNASEEFRNNILPGLLQQYAKHDIFNVDETGIYFRGLPDRGYSFKNETLKGGKKAKDRITVLVCANMSGTEKEKLMVIGKSKQPRQFPRDLTTLPVTYRNSSNAWMTGAIFREHLDNWNRRLRMKNRTILLLLDNCSAHPADMTFSNIEIKFLPPNTTSVLQPMDMGVIRNLKGHYRTLINSRIIMELDSDETKTVIHLAKAISLLDAIYMLHSAWGKVSQQTIANCYGKAGFAEMPECATAVDLLPIPERLTAEEFEALIDQDQDLEVCGILTDTELVESVKRQKISEKDEEEDDDDDEIEDVVQMPTTTELSSAVRAIRVFLQMQGESVMLQQFGDIEKEVARHAIKNKTQTTITSFFPKTN